MATFFFVDSWGLSGLGLDVFLRFEHVHAYSLVFCWTCPYCFCTLRTLIASRTLLSFHLLDFGTYCLQDLCNLCLGDLAASSLQPGMRSLSCMLHAYAYYTSVARFVRTCGFLPKVKSVSANAESCKPSTSTVRVSGKLCKHAAHTASAAIASCGTPFPREVGHRDYNFLFLYMSSTPGKMRIAAFGASLGTARAPANSNTQSMAKAPHPRHGEQRILYIFFFRPRVSIAPQYIHFSVSGPRTRHNVFLPDTWIAKLPNQSRLLAKLSISSNTLLQLRICISAKESQFNSHPTLLPESQSLKETHTTDATPPLSSASACPGLDHSAHLVMPPHKLSKTPSCCTICTCSPWKDLKNILHFYMYTYYIDKTCTYIRIYIRDLSSPKAKVHFSTTEQLSCCQLTQLPRKDRREAKRSRPLLAMCFEVTSTRLHVQPLPTYTLYIDDDTSSRLQHKQMKTRIYSVGSTSENNTITPPAVLHVREPAATVKDDALSQTSQDTTESAQLPKVPSCQTPRPS